MIGGMGTSELLIILVVVLILFGPKNLPKLGSSLGKTVKNVREGMEGTNESSDDNKPEAIEAEDVVVEIAEDDEVEFCNKCGAKNAKGSAFCNKCGAKIVSAQDPE